MQRLDTAAAEAVIAANAFYDALVKPEFYSVEALGLIMEHLMDIDCSDEEPRVQRVVVEYRRYINELLVEAGS